MTLKNLIQPEADSSGTNRGLPWHEAVIVSGALTIGLFLMKWQVGAPEGFDEYASLIMAVLVAPSIAYAALRRGWLVAALCLWIYVSELMSYM